MARVVQGLVYLRGCQYLPALENFDAALRVDSHLAIAHLGRGRALTELARPAEAIEAYHEAIELDPNNAAPYVRLGQLLTRLGNIEAADDAFTNALSRDFRDVAAHEGHARSLVALGRYPEAVEAYDRLLQIDPSSDYILGERFHAQAHCCDWRDFDLTRDLIAARVRQGERADFPGSFNTHCDSPADQLACARIFCADFFPPGSASRRAAPNFGGRIRVAYLSADFRAHATAFLAAGLFETHDRSKLEIFALSYGPDDGSAMRRRMEHAFEHFIDVRHFSDAQVAALIEELGIHIAVDVKGHTSGGRLGILASRPAPIQISFLAYPGTLGVDFVDYIIADRHVIPADSQMHYSEKVISLPGSYQVNDSTRIVNPPPSRSSAALPDSAFVFCCFNDAYKITPAVFDLWMGILKELPDSVLWLLAGAPVTVMNLQREAERRGIAESRLIFAPRQGPEEHLARIALADLFLDTFPCTAHTTASDALWVGVPVLTRTGATFMSRVATSLLHAVDCSELAVDGFDAYKRKAIELARNPVGLGRLKRHLRRARTLSPLFDTVSYTRALEKAYFAIKERYCSGAPPDALQI
jgi:predicted O-linked N-acetylglucosamine transferase (SPINDLY family)